MIAHDVDVAIIGAGPAGLAAAVSAKENGAKNVLILATTTSTDNTGLLDYLVPVFTNETGIDLKCGS